MKPEILLTKNKNLNYEFKDMTSLLTKTMNNQKQQQNPNQVTASVQPITGSTTDSMTTDSIMINSITKYKKAVDNWKIKTNNYWKARNHASSTGGAFLCVEPPSKPKLENFI